MYAATYREDCGWGRVGRGADKVYERRLERGWLRELSEGDVCHAEVLAAERAQHLHDVRWGGQRACVGRNLLETAGEEKFDVEDLNRKVVVCGV